MNGQDTIILLSCYELGHQPLNLAWPAAVLRQNGFRVLTCDLSEESFRPGDVSQAFLIAISVPMHTALRLGVDVARRIRSLNPAAHICFYGLYAWLNQEYLLANTAGMALADSVLAGEVEEELATLARTLSGTGTFAAYGGVGTLDEPAQPVMARLNLPVPDRVGLPSLTRYAHFLADGVAVPSGYAESTRGCLHTCRHCPITPVYQGRFFVTPLATVMADIRQQVAEGAMHITFGDPDFLNGPGHALRVARALHAEFPALTFNFTTKVEHILKHAGLMPEFVVLGASFIVSAFEATADHVLTRLKKGHNTSDLDRALDILKQAGLTVLPTWVPFTPWTSLRDYLDMLDWIWTRGLVAHVSGVQMSVRLLVPPQSALLELPDADAWCGPLDAANYTFSWTHSDPCMDELQQMAASEAEYYADDPLRAFLAIEKLAYDLAGEPPPIRLPDMTLHLQPPRLTEDWFC